MNVATETDFCLFRAGDVVQVRTQDGTPYPGELGTVTDINEYGDDWWANAAKGEHVIGVTLDSGLKVCFGNLEVELVYPNGE